LQIPMRSDNYVTEMMSFMQQFAVLANWRILDHVTTWWSSSV
jgi:hypothetical protein